MSTAPGLHALVLALSTCRSPGSVDSIQRVAFDLELRHSLSSERRLEVSEARFNARLRNYDNVQYNVAIRIGRCNEQVFHVVPDTGSSDLWVPLSNCTQCPAHSARYDLGESCSVDTVGERIHFKYGDGTTASGVTLFDTVHVGDVVVGNQYFIGVDDMSSATRMISDGILGLAHHYVDDASGGHTFMSMLFSQHPQLPRMFSLFLTSSSTRASQLIFGDPNVAAFAKEDFHFGKTHYMSSTDLWLTSVWSIGWSNTGTSYSFPDRGTLGAPALIDSGSSLIVLAPEIHSHLVADITQRLLRCEMLETEALLMCDCPAPHVLEQMPSLVINIIDEDDRQYGLCMAPDEYIMQSRDPYTGAAKCVPSLQRGSSHQPVPLIFGMTFMRSFYTTFDVANHRIGFARSSLSPLPADAKCVLYTRPLARRLLWWASLMMAAMSVAFCVYVFLDLRCGDDRDSNPLVSET